MVYILICSCKRMYVSKVKGFQEGQCPAKHGRRPALNREELPAVSSADQCDGGVLHVGVWPHTTLNVIKLLTLPSTTTYLPNNLPLLCTSTTSIQVDYFYYKTNEYVPYNMIRG